MKAFGYLRVSTEEQANFGVSLDVQKEKIRAYASLKDMELIQIFTDDGKSAKDLNRPGVTQMMGQIESGYADAIIVFKLDRMFRSTINALETMEKLKKKNIALHSIQENFDTESAFGKFFFTILAALGQMERELIGERTKVALTHLKKQGKVYGTVPYGLKNAEGYLIENEFEQSVIKKIKDLYMITKSYRRVTEILNEEGVMTRKGEGKWYAQQIKNILLGGQ